MIFSPNTKRNRAGGSSPSQAAAPSSPPPPCSIHPLLMEETNQYRSQCLVMGDWASTPEELWEMVATLLRSNIADLVRFASVCRSWRSIVVRNRCSLSSNIPWLLFPTGPPEVMSYCLVSPFDTTRDYALSLSGRIKYDHLLVGAYESWLLFACGDETLYLYNPFSCDQVSLPRCGIFAGSVDKFVLSANPNEGVDWSLMAMVDGHKLLLYTSWDRAWTFFTSGMPLDLVYDHPGRFLALDVSGKFLVVSFEGHSYSTSEIASDFEFADMNFLLTTFKSGMMIKNHLVSSSKQVLRVIRIYRKGDKETIAFKVFKLDWSTKKMIPIHHLDDSVLFVSKNFAGSRKASETPGSRENCIYFMECRNGFHEMVACCLEGMRFERLVHRPDIRHPEWEYLRNYAFWFTPSLS